MLKLKKIITPFFGDFFKLKLIMKKPWLQVVVICFLLILLRFFPFLQGKTLIFGDNYSLMIPGKLFTAHWLKQGILPLWNPNIFAGLPWIGDVNQSVLYPTSVLFMFFHPAVALNLSIVCHLVIAFIGMYLLLKQVKLSHYLSLLGAMLWMLSTQVAGSIHNLSTIQSIVWFPVIMFFGLSIAKNWRYKVFYALAVTAQFAGGYPQHVIYSILASVIFNLIFQDFSSQKTKDRLQFWKNWIINWLMTAFLVLSLSAVIWLPFVELLLQSTRMEQTATQATTGSLNPLMLIKAIVPYFFDKQTAGFKWGPTWSGQPNVLFYFTWFGLIALLAPITKNSWNHRNKIINLSLWLVIFLTLLFALGSYLPGFAWLQVAMPFFRIGRYPSMTLVITTLALIVLLLRRLSVLTLVNKTYYRLQALNSLVLIVFLFLLILVTVKFQSLWHFVDNLLNLRLSQSSFHTLARDEIIVKAIVQNIVVSSGLLALALGSWFHQKKQLLLLVIAIDMIYATQGMFIFAPNRVYDVEFVELPVYDAQYRSLTRNSNYPYTDYGSYWEALIVRAPFSDSFIDDAELTTFDHLARLKFGLTPDWNMVNHMPIINGYTTLLPKNYAQLWQKSSEPRINFIDYVDLKDDQQLLSNWAVKYYLVDYQFVQPEQLIEAKLIQTQTDWGLYELPARARVRFSQEDEVNLLTDDHEIILTPENFHETPNKISLTIDNDNNYANLIVADRYDQDWVAQVNQQPVVIKSVNQMRQIPLQPGLNKLEMSYQPKLFYLGLRLSALTFLLSVIIPVTLSINRRIKLQS